MERAVCVTGVILGIFLLAGFALAVDPAPEIQQPFPGKYRLVGDVGKLVGGDRIVVEEFISPVCPNCYLYHKYAKPLAGDVQVQVHYLFHDSKGKLPIKLLLLARESGPEMEGKTLETLFNANFENKVNIEDPEVLGAVAQSLGLGEAWTDEKKSCALDKKLSELEAFLHKRGVDRTPTILIQDALMVSSGTCRCTGDELPGVVSEVVDQLRAYRKEKMK